MVIFWWRDFFVNLKLVFYKLLKAAVLCWKKNYIERDCICHKILLFSYHYWNYRKFLKNTAYYPWYEQVKTIFIDYAKSIWVIYCDWFTLKARYWHSRHIECNLTNKIVVFFFCLTAHAHLLCSYSKNNLRFYTYKLAFVKYLSAYMYAYSFYLVW